MAYQFVNCGGVNKQRDTILHKLAVGRTRNTKPSCGCDVCYANLLLFHLYQERLLAGINPYTGAEG